MTAPAYETGAIYSDAMPAGQRAWYEQVLLQNLRTKSILTPFTIMKEDFAARDTGRITYSEVFDLEPNWNALSESTIWMKGAHLDSRSVTIELEIHGDVVKISDFNELTNFFNNGDLTSLCKGKLGQSMVDVFDILARNEFLATPYKSFGGGKANRAALTAADLFEPDLAEHIRTHLEEREVPGVQATQDSDVQTIVCVTTPRVIHDIRMGANGKTPWLDVNSYAGGVRKFTGEAGTWSGVRFLRTNRLVLKNAGAKIAQATLAEAVVPGQGAATTVDKVYTVGQSTSKRYVLINEAMPAEFLVGKTLTIHSADLGDVVLEADGTQETRRIVDVDAANKKLVFDKPFLKDHAAGDYVTLAIDVHGSIFLGGPGVVFGVGERAHPIILPKIDDMGMINRFSWRSFSKMQLFRPEMFEIVETVGSVD
jgi:N4-gp56 family major capsid protein